MVQLYSVFGHTLLSKPLLFPLVEDARWWDEWVIQMEEAKTLTKASSPCGSKSCWSDGPNPVQRSQQQQPFR